MKVSCDNKELFSLSDIQKRVICNDINEDELDVDLKRRLQWILVHKYEQCFKRLKEEWEPKLKANGVKAFPVDDEEFAKLVFSQKNYLSRKQRDELSAKEALDRQVSVSSDALKAE